MFTATALFGELLAGLAQQKMIELVEWIVDGRDLQAEVIDEAPQREADRQLLLADAADLGKAFGGQAGERGYAAARSVVEDLHRFLESIVDLVATVGEVLPDGLGEQVLLCHAVMRSAVAPCASRV